LQRSFKKLQTVANIYLKRCKKITKSAIINFKSFKNIHTLQRSFEEISNVSNIYQKGAEGYQKFLKCTNKLKNCKKILKVTNIYSISIQKDIKICKYLLKVANIYRELQTYIKSFKIFTKKLQKYIKSCKYLPNNCKYLLKRFQKSAIS
jgi:hypothetical protein